MLTPKSLLYLLTIAAGFFFAFWELKLKRQVINDAPREPENVSDLGWYSALREQVWRERLLGSLPREKLAKLRVIMRLKFLCVAVLVIEVICLQR